MYISEELIQLQEKNILSKVIFLFLSLHLSIYTRIYMHIIYLK